MTNSSYFIKFDETRSELLAAVAKMDEMHKVAHLLQTLPSTYNGVIADIETLSHETLSLAFVNTNY